jgi:hypothetical protein
MRPAEPTIVARTGRAETIEVATSAVAPLDVLSRTAARASTPVLAIAPDAVTCDGVPITKEANESG